MNQSALRILNSLTPMFVRMAARRRYLRVDGCVLYDSSVFLALEGDNFDTLLVIIFSSS